MAQERISTLLVTPGILPLLRDLIHERTGIFFEETRLDLLQEKIEPLAAAKGCRSCLDYYYLLKYEANGTEDWALLMDALSVQETYFWRESSQIHALANVIAPAWFARNPSSPLRIWSAASATGEEAYSIAIALVEAGWGSHPVQIYGSDGSPSAIAKANAGVYREKAFRTLAEPLRRKYFTPQGSEWALNPEIKSRVKFQRANLLEPEQIDTLARAQVIFCRNVFIYFSAHAIRQTVATFARRMPSGGHLFVGASESLLRLTSDFELREIGDAFVYVRN
ncbi:MAG TPA: protein-glutamate O-methyltransferase CheR [Methylomirabilota bacterium]|nr:protein-glutamate O-methyltransferase CheR [Methylomirabilota bacterium]